MGEDLSAYCSQHGILLQGFGWNRPEVLESADVQEVAMEVAQPPLSVVAQWFLQQGLVPLYKTTRLERLLEFAEALRGFPQLTQSQLATVGRTNQLDYPWRYYRGEAENPWTT